MRRLSVAGSAAITLAASLFLITAVPAQAADDGVCATMPAQIRAAAAKLEDAPARRALGYVATGEKLCEAGNERAAARKFNQALALVPDASAVALAPAPQVTPGQ